MSKQLPAKWNPALFDQLTSMQQAFVTHPMVYTDPVEAAIDVGYSEGTAKSQAHIMRKQLMYYIMPLHEKRMEDLGAISIGRIIQELEAIALANEADYYDTIDIDGDTVKVLKDIKLLPEPMQRAIKEVTFETVQVAKGEQLLTYQKLTSIKLHDKMQALRELAEIRGAKDPRFRKPEAPEDEQAELLKHMEPEEVEQMAQVLDRAAARAKAAANKKRDARAIPGEVMKRGPNEKRPPKV